MQTFDEDKASISGIFAILKLISEELGLIAGGVAVGLDIKVIMYQCIMGTT